MKISFYPLLALLALPSVQAETWQNTMLDRYNLKRAQIAEVSGESGGSMAHGAFFLDGRISVQVASQRQSKFAKVAGADTAPSAALVAEQFIADNVDLLNLTSVEQLALERIDTDRFGNHHLRYDRVELGYKLRNMQVLIHLDKDLDVTSVNGEINHVDAPLAAYLAAKVQTGQRSELNEQSLRIIIAALSNVRVAGVNIHKAELLAQNSEPYLYWQLQVHDGRDGSRSYWRIADATGELMYKRDALSHHPRRHSPGFSPAQGDTAQ